MDIKMEKKLNVVGYYWDGTVSWIIYQDKKGNSIFKRNEKKSNC